MARQERNEVDYFPHSVRHGKKMFYLRSKFGNDGYAVWFMLLENIGKASYHYLNLSDDVELMYLSSELKVSDIVLTEIIKDLVKLDEFDKELWEENKILFNEKFIENISDAYKKRNNNCIDRNSLLLLLESKGIRKPSKGNPKPPKLPLKGVGNPQRIVKESKGEESIEENNKVLPLKVNPNKVNEVLKMFDERNFEQIQRTYKTNKENIRIKLLEFLETESLSDTFVNKPLGNVITHFIRWMKYNNPREVVSKDNSVPSWITDKR